MKKKSSSIFNVFPLPLHLKLIISQDVLFSGQREESRRTGVSGTLIDFRMKNNSHAYPLACYADATLQLIHIHARRSEVPAYIYKENNKESALE